LELIAQVNTWEVEIPNDVACAPIFAFVETEDGYIALGSCNSYPTGQLHLIKLAKDGSFLDSVIIREDSVKIQLQSSTKVESYDSLFIVAASRVYPDWKNDPGILVFDKDLNYSHHSWYIEDYTYIYDLVCYDTICVGAGVSRPYEWFGSTQNVSMHFTIYGELLSHLVSGSGLFFDYTPTIEKESDSTFVVSRGQSVVDIYESDIEIAEINHNYETINAQLYDVSGKICEGMLRRNPLNDQLIHGTCRSDIIVTWGHDEDVPTLRAYDSDYQVIWEKYISWSTSNQLSHISLTPEGDILVVGQGKNNVMERRNGYLYKYSAEGDSLWGREFAVEGPGVTGSEIWSALSASDGGILVGGFVYGSFPSRFYIAKLDSNGCLNPPCDLPLGMSVNQEHKFTISPNPVNSKLIVSGLTLHESQLTIEIYDSKGVLWQEQNLAPLPSEIDVSSLSPGSYIAHVFGQNGNVGRIPFVKN
jgi:hypothetical protein